jgi:hypothetical protein
MPVSTVAFSCRVVPEAQEALRRLSFMTRWSQARLIERVILNLQDEYVGALTEGERQRYKMGTMNFIEFREILRRKGSVASAPKANGAASSEALVNSNAANLVRSAMVKFGDFLGDAA